MLRFPVVLPPDDPPPIAARVRVTGALLTVIVPVLGPVPGVTGLDIAIV
jgi:hypothetical protein